MKTPYDTGILNNALACTPVGGCVTIPEPLAINVEVDTKYFDKLQLCALRTNSTFAGDPDNCPTAKTKKGNNGENPRKCRKQDKATPRIPDRRRNSTGNTDGKEFHVDYSDSDKLIPFDPLQETTDVSKKIIISILEGKSKHREQVQIDGKLVCTSLVE
jgi:hypothetical protein